MIKIKTVSPHDEAVQALIAKLDTYQNSLYPAESNHLDSIGTLKKENIYFVGAFKSEVLVGCGAVKVKPEAYGEIKRVFVSPQARGQGVSKLMMNHLEAWLLENDISLARLETGIYQTEALSLYERRGYTEIGPFGDYAVDSLSVFMEKKLRNNT